MRTKEKANAEVESLVMDGDGGWGFSTHGELMRFLLEYADLDELWVWVWDGNSRYECSALEILDRWAFTGTRWERN